MRSVLILIALASVAHADPEWLTLGAVLEPQHYDGAKGVRGEADLLASYGWTAGVALSASEASIGVYGRTTIIFATEDLAALAFVARTAQFERWSLRGTLGAGVLSTTASGEPQNAGNLISLSAVLGTAEASVRAIVPISPSWAISSGLIATYYGQTFSVAGNTPYDDTKRTGVLMMLFGLSYRI